MAWNGSNGEKAKSRGEGEQRREKHSSVRLSSSPSPKFNYKALVAGLVVVIGGAIAAWVMTRGERGEKGESGERVRASQIAEAKSAVVTNAPVAVVETNAEDMVTLPDGRRVKKPKTLAEAVALVPLKPGMHRYKSVDDFFAKTNDFQIGGYKPALFKHRVESSLGMIATRRRDMVMPPMPPLPPNAEQDFFNSLTHSMEVIEGEDPKDTETRMRVEEMKLAMKELMEKEGLTVGEAFRKMETEHNRLANMTQLYKGTYVKMKLSGSPDAEAFLKRANEDLRKAGACEFDEDAKTINP